MSSDSASEFSVRRACRSRTGRPAAAASRQKSCNACVRGKRRCDKTMPTCTRCATKGIQCVYQKLPRGMPPSSAHPPSSFASASAINPSAGPTDADLHLDLEADPCPNMTPDFTMGGLGMGDCDTGVAGGSISSQSHTPGTGTTSPKTLELDPSLNFSMEDILGVTPYSTSSMNSWELLGLGEPKADFPAPVPVVSQENGRTPLRDTAILDRAMNSCPTTDPLIVHNPRTAIGFVYRYLCELHIEFARTHTQVFIHPQLYGKRVPRALMTAFGAATAYANRTAENKAWTLQLLAESAREVHAEGRNASSPLDRLARVQALLVIDSMRVLDGDILLRNAATKEMHILMSWLKDLDAEAGRYESPANASRERPPKSWEEWVLAESMRRTHVTVLSFLCIIQTLNMDAPSREFCLSVNFTASRHLWEAPSSVQFFRAWRERPQWCIHLWNMRELWKYAHADDMDELTRIILTAQVGPDVMDRFMDVGERVLPVS